MKLDVRRRNAIIRRARNGESYASIARHFDVTARTVNAVALAAGVRRHAPPGTGRNTIDRPCQFCGSPTRSTTRTCVTCYRANMADEIPLKGGRWEPRGGIVVWVADDRTPVQRPSSEGESRYSKGTSTARPQPRIWRSATRASDRLQGVDL